MVGFGPVAAFAAELRELKHQSGMTFEQMSPAANYSPAQLSNIANGRSLPTAKHVERFVKGCGVDDPAVVKLWLEKRERAADSARRFSPDLSACRTANDVVDALAELAHEVVEASGVADELARRLAGEAGQPKPHRAVESLTADEIRRLLFGGSSSLDSTRLASLVFACGGTKEDIDHWQARWAVVPKLTPRPSPALPDGRRLTRRRMLVGAAIGTTAAGVMGVGYWISRGSERLGTASAPSATPSKATPFAARLTVAEVLQDLGRQVRALPERIPVGRYTHIHIKVWSRDTAVGAPHEVDKFDDEFVWWDARRTGHRRRVATVAGGQRQRHDVALRGDLSLVIDNPSEDWGILRYQLDRQNPPFLGVVGTLRAIADTCKIHLLNPGQRAAALEVLSRSDALEYDDVLTDPIGRYGRAVSAVVDLDGRRQQDRLIFDESSGVLLYHVQNALEDGVPVTMQQTVYMARTRTDQLG
jgi:transcriptional regulator with XRE-family HTH domain